MLLCAVVSRARCCLLLQPETAVASVDTTLSASGDGAFAWGALYAARNNSDVTSSPLMHHSPLGFNRRGFPGVIARLDVPLGRRRRHVSAAARTTALRFPACPTAGWRGDFGGRCTSSQCQAYLSGTAARLHGLLKLSRFHAS